jgi:nucleoside-diphosphate-sugar epimerase
VTGGGGFLGGAIIRQLQAQGDCVRSVSRSHYPALAIDQVQGDLADPGVAERAVSGCDVVFHVAAKAGVAGRYGDYYRANVEATRAQSSTLARACGVRRSDATLIAQCRIR